MVKITVNKLWYDRRSHDKPTWLCRITGGRGPNAESVVGVGVGCCRAIAFARAMRQFRKAKKFA
jgi:hypothetical protein